MIDTLEVETPPVITAPRRRRRLVVLGIVVAAGLAAGSTAWAISRPGTASATIQIGTDVPGTTFVAHVTSGSWERTLHVAAGQISRVDGVPYGMVQIEVVGLCTVAAPLGDGHSKISLGYQSKHCVLGSD